jgi:predicted porin
VRAKSQSAALLAVMWSLSALAQQDPQVAQTQPMTEPPKTSGTPTPTPAPLPSAPPKEEKKKEPSRLIELYGKLYPELMAPTSGLWHPAVFGNEGATPDDATNVATFAASLDGSPLVMREIEFASSNSKFGLRGHQKLGGDFKGIFQLETLFAINGASTTFGTLDSFVGLSNERYGTVKLGRFNTPFKEYGDDISFLGVSAGNFTSTSTVLRRPGFGGNNASRFHERRSNSIEYDSPELYGFELAIQYSSDLARVAIRDPHMWSAGLKWGMGDFEVAIAHEIHNDLYGLSRNVPRALRNIDASSTLATGAPNPNFLNPLAPDTEVHSTDRATSLMLKYKLGNHGFEFDINDKRYLESSTVAGRAHSYQNNSYLLIWDARWSPEWRTQIHYVGSTPGTCTVIGASCSTEGLEGSQISAGVAYHFSRPTYVFAMASWVRNGTSAQFNTLQNSNQDLAVGEDITQYAVGIHHSFDVTLHERP